MANIDVIWVKNWVKSKFLTLEASYINKYCVSTIPPPPTDSAFMIFKQHKESKQIPFINIYTSQLSVFRGHSDNRTKY